MPGQEDEFRTDREEDPVSVAFPLESHSRQGWTTDDLDAFPEDNRRRELVDGALVLSPSPTSFHQTLAMLLGARLFRDCPQALHVTQGVEVRINRTRSLIPDVLVVTATASARNPHHYAPHEVMLAVEIVSAGSRAMDRVLKPALYAEAGIPLYWCLETEPDVVVNAYRLAGEGRVYLPSGKSTEVIEVDQPWQIRLPVTDILPGRPARGS